MDDFMQDRGFLEEVNLYRVKTYYAAIMVLDFETERPITRLEGKVVSGTISVSAKSPTRRTGSLQVIFDASTFDLTNIDNLIAINKKISLSIGLKNPFYDSGNYRNYGDTLWFKQGLFLITGASSSLSATSRTINIQFIDKMGMLNGVCGGTLPASVSLHDRIEIDPEENVTTTYPRINQIIREVVNHFGGEHPSRIIVTEVPDFGRQVVTWAGSTPVWFSQNNGAFQVSDSPPVGFPEQYILGDDIGYMSTPLTYPGELVMKAGSTVTQILDEIVKTLGNFEYFYDVDGIFHFQQIQNFDKTGQAPVLSTYTNSDGNSAFNIYPSLDLNFQQNYIPKYAHDQFLNEFKNSELVTQVSLNPAYSNIKNDFVVWGSRKATKDEERLVRYHLAIDEKPREDMFDNFRRSLCSQWIWVIRNKETKVIRRYAAYMNGSTPSVTDLSEEMILHSPALSTLPAGSYQFNWREELYRRALLAFNESDRGSYYDEELLAEWRYIFNPLVQSIQLDGSINQYSATFQSEWEDYFGHALNAPVWSGYNVDVIRKPQNIRYWLDIIDTNSLVGQYSVPRIGRRTIVKENNKINEVLNREVPDIVFIDGTETVEEINLAEDEYLAIGQHYCIVREDYLPYFSLRNSFGTCYEEIRDLFHIHLMYNSQTTLSCVPILYLDVNKVVRLNFPDLGIVGNYIINTISFNLGNMSTMNIQANEVIVIV